MAITRKILEQENQKKSRKRHEGDGDVVEIYHKDLGTYFGIANHRAWQTFNDISLNQVVIPGDDSSNAGEPNTGQGTIALLPPQSGRKKYDLRIHKNPLKPAELAGVKPGNLGIKKATESRGQSYEKREKIRVLGEKSDHGVALLSQKKKQQQHDHQENL